MTAGDVIKLVREQLNDTFQESYRFKDPEILRALTEACYKLEEDRPDRLLNSSGELITVVDVTSTGDTLKFDTKMRFALASLVSSKLLMKDSSDDFNGALAKEHMKSYINEI